MTDPRPHGFTHRPEARSLGSALRGQEMVDGALPLTGLRLQGEPFAHRLADADHMAELHGFGWLDDLAAVGNAKARDLAQARVLDWLAAHPAPPGSRHCRPAPSPRCC